MTRTSRDIEGGWEEVLGGVRKRVIIFKKTAPPKGLPKTPLTKEGGELM